MRVVPKPTLSVEAVYDDCVGGIGSPGKKFRFNLHKINILSAANDYEIKASSSDLFQVPMYGSDGLITAPIVTKKELKNLYEAQMAKVSRPGRDYYDSLRASTKLCPFCGISSTKTLEHYLPKAHYPDLAVLPINLIPCCRDCNTEKSDTRVRRIQDQNIHPYYDDFTQEQWLFADIVNADGPTAIFRVSAPAQWELKSKYKVENHLVTYDLGGRFGDLSSDEISGIATEMRKLLLDTNSVIVREDLLERANSHAVNHLNSWKVALYQALANSPWYCAGNFR